MTKKQRLLNILQAWQGQRLLVLGDVVADEHLVGRPLGVAREAPVLVLEYLDRRLLPGGATNVAANAAALGAMVQLCGVVGDDEIGRSLTATLERGGMDCTGVVIDPRRPTTTKSRVWAGGTQQRVQQLLLRVDRVDRRAVPDAVTEQMAAYIRRALDDVQSLVISDYENGVIHPGLIAASLPPAIERGRVVAVDSHGDLYRFRGATLFTPNQPEAEATLRRSLVDARDVEAGGRELLVGLEARAVLITRGQAGMTLIARDAPSYHLPARQTAAAVDPTGAGDTVSATFTLAVAAGASLAEAAELANLAAAIVVGRVGTATASADELAQAIEGAAA